MFNISTKYSQNSDFRAILVNKSSNLSSLRSLIDQKSANELSKLPSLHSPVLKKYGLCLPEFNVKLPNLSIS